MPRGDYGRRRCYWSRRWSHWSGCRRWSSRCSRSPTATTTRQFIPRYLINALFNPRRQERLANFPPFSCTFFPPIVTPVRRRRHWCCRWLPCHWSGRQLPTKPRLLYPRSDGVCHHRPFWGVCKLSRIYWQARSWATPRALCLCLCQCLCDCRVKVRRRAGLHKITSGIWVIRHTFYALWCSIGVKG